MNFFKILFVFLISFSAFSRPEYGLYGGWKVKLDEDSNLYLHPNKTIRGYKNDQYEKFSKKYNCESPEKVLCNPILYFNRESKTPLCIKRHPARTITERCSKDFMESNGREKQAYFDDMVRDLIGKEADEKSEWARLYNDTSDWVSLCFENPEMEREKVKKGEVRKSYKENKNSTVNVDCKNNKKAMDFISSRFGINRSYKIASEMLEKLNDGKYPQYLLDENCEWKQGGETYLKALDEMTSESECLAKKDRKNLTTVGLYTALAWIVDNENCGYKFVRPSNDDEENPEARLPMNGSCHVFLKNFEGEDPFNSKEKRGKSLSLMLLKDKESFVGHEKINITMPKNGDNFSARDWYMHILENNENLKNCEKSPEELPPAPEDSHVHIAGSHKDETNSENESTVDGVETTEVIKEEKIEPEKVDEVIEELEENDTPIVIEQNGNKIFVIRQSATEVKTISRDGVIKHFEKKSSDIKILYKGIDDNGKPVYQLPDEEFKKLGLEHSSFNGEDEKGQYWVSTNGAQQYKIYPDKTIKMMGLPNRSSGKMPGEFDREGQKYLGIKGSNGESNQVYPITYKEVDGEKKAYIDHFNPNWLKMIDYENKPKGEIDGRQYTLLEGGYYIFHDDGEIQHRIKPASGTYQDKNQLSRQWTGPIKFEDGSHYAIEVNHDKNKSFKVISENNKMKLQNKGEDLKKLEELSRDPNSGVKKIKANSNDEKYYYRLEHDNGEGLNSHTIVRANGKVIPNVKNVEYVVEGFENPLVIENRNGKGFVSKESLDQFLKENPKASEEMKKEGTGSSEVYVLGEVKINANNGRVFAKNIAMKNNKEVVKESEKASNPEEMKKTTPFIGKGLQKFQSDIDELVQVQDPNNDGKDLVVVRVRPASALGELGKQQVVPVRAVETGRTFGHEGYVVSRLIDSRVTKDDQGSLIVVQTERYIYYNPTTGKYINLGQPGFDQATFEEISKLDSGSVFNQLMIDPKEVLSEKPKQREVKERQPASKNKFYVK